LLAATLHPIPRPSGPDLADARPTDISHWRFVAAYHDIAIRLNLESGGGRTHPMALVRNMPLNRGD